MPQPSGTFTEGWMGISFYGCVGGVEEELLPFEDGELLAEARSDDAVEVRVQGGDSGWNGYVKLVQVFIVAAPGDNLAVGGEDHSGDLVDGAGGAMVAGNPLGCGEGDGAGFHGD